jgi:O-antigen ligase
MAQLFATKASGEVQSRFAAKLLWLAGLLWAVEVYRPPLSYPWQGVIELFVLLILAGCAAYVQWPVRKSSFGGTSASIAGCLFVLYAVGRWIAQGRPSIGDENFDTLLICAIYASIIYALAAASFPIKFATLPILLLVSAIALLCSIHAIAQYMWLYDRSARELEREIASSGAQPTALQIGLLHHFRLRRVASVWGDPNTLGGFLAVSIPLCAGGMYTLARRFADRPFVRRGIFIFFGISTACSLIGIYLSGSRGAVLDLVFIAVLSIAVRYRSKVRPFCAAASILLCVGLVHASSKAQNGFFSRSNTIVERLNYWEIGAKIFERAPVFGSGFGAVDRFYGRFKPEFARETKYLHNWILQIAVEMGITGLAGAAVFLALLFLRVRDRRLCAWEKSIYIAIAAFCVDALIQHSYNQREMMALFGILCGLALNTGTEISSRDTGYGRIAVLSSAAAGLLLLLVPVQLGSAFKDSAATEIEAGQFTAALQNLRKSARFAPRDPQVPAMMASIAGSPGSAILFLKKALKLNPESAALHSSLASAYLRENEVIQAKQEIMLSLHYYPSNAEYHYECSRILDLQGDRTAAIREAREAVRLGYLYLDKYKAHLNNLLGKSPAEIPAEK